MKNLQKAKKFIIKNQGTISLIVASMLITVDANAFVAPQETDTLYKVYDLVVNDFLKGPIGFVAGIAMIAYGVIALVSAKYVQAITSMAAGGLLSTVDAITKSFGITIGVM